MYIQKKAMVLIYVLFLVTLSVIFATIILNNNSYLFNITSYFSNESKLNTNINNDSQINVDLNIEYNSDGTGFIDNLSCPPDFTITMSGNTLKEDIGSVLVNTGGTIYCEGSYQSNILKIFFNSGFTDFENADYNGSVVNLTSGLGDSLFSDGDFTLIDFSSYNYNVSDGYDDNFNSDNYKVTSTGTTATGTYYLNGFQDNDVVARKKIIGYTSPDDGFKKVFWNTSKTSNIIDNNTNNNDLLNIKIGDVDYGYLYLDIDKSSDIKLVQFDKNMYEDTNELKILGSLKGSIFAGSGYLQNNFGILGLSTSITGNEYVFDFTSKDYALFIKSTGTDTLLYNVVGETYYGTGIYLTPIDDSDENIITYLGNEIIIDDDLQFIAKETELIYKK